MSEKHLSSQFDAELDGVSARVREMGGLVESQVAQALHALTRLDERVADRVILLTGQVHAMELEIHREIALIIARRQPAARDLRLLMAISRVAGDLACAGREAARIAGIARKLGATGMSTRLPVEDISGVAGLPNAQLRKALDAFARLDLGRALQVIDEEALLDQEVDRLARRLVTGMVEDPRTISASIDLVLVATAIECIGKRARKLAEQVVYILKGADVRPLPPARVEPSLG